MGKMQMRCGVLLVVSFLVLLLCDGILACIPPPVVECKGAANSDCSVFSYMGVWEDRSTCTTAMAALPRTEAELVQAVAHAVKNKQKMRVVSRLSHSLPKLVCVASQGVVIGTTDYDSIVAINKTAMTITVQAGAMMRNVLDAAAKEGLALNAMIYWDGVSAAGVVSTGAHGSGLAGRGSGVYEYVVAMRIVVPATPQDGYAKVITLTQEDQDLKAAVLSLGTLGAISEITFALEPMYKRSVTYTLHNDDGLGQDLVETFLRKHEFGDMYWYPSHGKIVLGDIRRLPVDAPGNGVNKNANFRPTSVAVIGKNASSTISIQEHEDTDSICKVGAEAIYAKTIGGSGFLNDGNTFTGFPVTGLNHLMQTSGGCQNYALKYENNTLCTRDKILDQNLAVCTWDRRANGTYYWDLELRVLLSRVGDAIRDIKKLRDLNLKAMCELDQNAIGFRSIKKSEVYLGPAEDTVTMEILYYRPREPGVPKWNGDWYDEIVQMLIEKHGGTLHWGKSGGYLFGGLAKRTTDMEKFLEVKERFDPEGLFSSDWTDGVFGIGGKDLTVWRDGCALDRICKCKEDRHCAPEKGYFCRPGRVWKNARVCRQER